jgi:hypothetical protein
MCQLRKRGFSIMFKCPGSSHYICNWATLFQPHLIYLGCFITLPWSVYRLCVANEKCRVWSGQSSGQFCPTDIDKLLWGELLTSNKGGGHPFGQKSGTPPTLSKFILLSRKINQNRRKKPKIALKKSTST